MDGLIIHKCQSCEDDANLYCRLCKMHFCPDHACLHLNTAQQSYTERLDKEVNHVHRESTPTESKCDLQDEVLLSRDLQSISPKSPDEISSPDVPMAEMSDETLRDWYEYYINRAKKYRNELERRAAPFARTYFGERATEVLGRVPKAPKAQKERGLSKSRTMALEYLQKQVKAGNLDADKILAKLRGL